MFMAISKVHIDLAGQQVWSRKKTKKQWDCTAAIFTQIGWIPKSLYRKSCCPSFEFVSIKLPENVSPFLILSWKQMSFLLAGSQLELKNYNRMPSKNYFLPFWSTWVAKNANHFLWLSSTKITWSSSRWYRYKSIFGVWKDI